MKRVLLSLLCGIAFVVGYLAFVPFLWGFLDLRNETVALLYRPLDLPHVIYEMIFGSSNDDRTVVRLLVETANVLIYSIPFYFIFTLYAKFKRKSEIKGTATPPEPPIFNKPN